MLNDVNQVQYELAKAHHRGLLDEARRLALCRCARDGRGKPGGVRVAFRLGMVRVGLWLIDSGRRRKAKASTA